MIAKKKILQEIYGEEDDDLTTATEGSSSAGEENADDVIVDDLIANAERRAGRQPLKNKTHAPQGCCLGTEKDFITSS